VKDSKYNVHSLADQSKVPRHKRKWEVTLTQEERIRHLRKRYPYYGKKELKVLYEKENSEGISTWKIERVIRRHKLYPDQKRAEKTARKRVRTPKDNPEIERFNCLHQSLSYLAPIEYIEKELAKIRSPVLPMWSASTLV
jgi:hypothetical protein